MDDFTLIGTPKVFVQDGEMTGEITVMNNDHEFSHTADFVLNLLKDGERVAEAWCLFGQLKAKEQVTISCDFRGPSTALVAYDDTDVGVFPVPG